MHKEPLVFHFLLRQCLLLGPPSVKAWSEADLETKRTEIAKELERAQQDLSDGWKAWPKEIGPGKSRGTKEVIRPAGGVTSKVRDWAARGRPEDGHEKALCVLTTGVLASNMNKNQSGTGVKWKQNMEGIMQNVTRNMQNMERSVQNMARNMQNMKQNMKNM
jgi:hypothetical protein